VISGKEFIKVLIPPLRGEAMSFEETISAECTTKTISIFATISICYKTTYNNNLHLP